MIKASWIILHPDAVVPRRATAGAAGIDLVSVEAKTILPGGNKIVSTGIGVALPKRSVLLVCSRSGMAANHGVFVLNAPGVVDSDYRGVIKVILHNAGPDAYSIAPGDRIAQAIILELPHVQHAVIETPQDAPATERGTNGLGSTGRA